MRPPCFKFQRAQEQTPANLNPRSISKPLGLRLSPISKHYRVTLNIGTYCWPWRLPAILLCMEILVAWLQKISTEIKTSEAICTSNSILDYSILPISCSSTCVLKHNPHLANSSSWYLYSTKHRTQWSNALFPLQNTSNIFAVQTAHHICVAKSQCEHTFITHLLAIIRGRGSSVRQHYSSYPGTNYDSFTWVVYFLMERLLQHQ
jgi:hypothetical protein